MKKILFILIILGGLGGCGLLSSEKSEDSKINDLLEEEIQLSADQEDSDEDLDEDLEGDFESLATDKGVKAQGTTEDELDLDEEFAGELDVDEPSLDLAEGELDLEEDEETFAIVQEPKEAELSDSIDGVAEVGSSEGGLANITNIEYLSVKGQETIRISASKKLSYSTRFNKVKGQFVVEIANSVLPESLKRPYLMKDFDGAQIAMVNAYQKEGSTVSRVIVQLIEGAHRPQAKLSSNKLDLIMPNLSGPKGAVATHGSKQNTSLTDFLLDNQTYSGQRISVSFNDTPVKDVIAFIASEVGANIVMDSISGKISLKLRNLPWDQVLTLIMKSKGLGYIRDKGVLRIAKLSTLKAEENSIHEIIKSQKEVEPLVVKVFPINFAQVNTVATQVKEFLTPKRGKVAFDNRTSSLIITDTRAVLDRLKQLIRGLDLPPRQVMIEGKFIEASEQFTKKLGVNWEFSGGSVDIDSLKGVGGPVSARLDRGRLVSSSASELSGLNGVLGLTIGRFKFLGNLTTLLAIGETENLVKVIATPRVLAMNKEKASITTKSENLSINAEVSGTGADTTESRTVVRTPINLKLDVTPQIAPDGSVIMGVNILREFPSGAPFGETGAVPISSRAVTTKILVGQGDTAVIGGLFEKDFTKAGSGVPFLRDVPFIGWLFKYRSTETAKREMMVFLTPTIIGPTKQ